MGLFKQKKASKSKDYKESISRVVTEAKDPLRLDKDKINKDLEKLEAWDKKIENVKVPEERKKRKVSPKVEQALKIENPFVGK
jgi:hypothetical protein